MLGSASHVQPVRRRRAKTQEVAGPRFAARRLHERSWVVKTSMRKNGAPLASVPQQSESSNEALRRKEEERSEESFEATIIRLDGRALELVLRLAGE